MNLILAYTDDGLPIGLRLDAPPYDTEGVTMAVLGNKGSGKSNTLAVLAEEAHRNHIPFVFFDPNGDAVSLVELGDDVVTVGNPGHVDAARRADYSADAARRDIQNFVKMVLEEGFSLVFDLSGDGDPAPHHTFAIYLKEHFRQAGRLRTPVFIFVDEAHLYAPQQKGSDEEEASRKILGQIASDGRKRGMVLVFATQRSTFIHKKILFGCNIRMFGKITYYPDFDALKYYLPPGYNHPKYGFSKMRHLHSGELIIVTQGAWQRIRIRRRKTTDLGQTPAFKPRRDKKRPSKKVQLQLKLFSDEKRKE